MLSQKNLFLGIILFLFSLTACQKETEKSPALQTFEVTLQHTVGEDSLQFNKKYKTLLGDEMNFTRFQYYFTNIELITEEGKVWKEKESYRLITVEDGKATISFKVDSLEAGKYTKIRFSIGVDSLRNSSGAQIGDLDPLLGMFWTWKTGYIFLKVEGYYNFNQNSRGGIVYHIGNNEAYRTITLNIPENTQNKIILKVDAQKVFGGFQGASLDLKLPSNGSSVSVMSGENLPKIANNYSQMFSVVVNN